MDQHMVFGEPAMIARLDAAIKELASYKASLDATRWRTETQRRIETIDIIMLLIRDRLYPSMPEPHEQKKAA